MLTVMWCVVFAMAATGHAVGGWGCAEVASWTSFCFLTHRQYSVRECDTSWHCTHEPIGEEVVGDDRSCQMMQVAASGLHD